MALCSNQTPAHSWSTTREHAALPAGRFPAPGASITDSQQFTWEGHYYEAWIWFFQEKIWTKIINMAILAVIILLLAMILWCLILQSTQSVQNSHVQCLREKP